MYVGNYWKRPPMSMSISVHVILLPISSIHPANKGHTRIASNVPFRVGNKCLFPYRNTCHFPYRTSVTTFVTNSVTNVIVIKSSITTSCMPTIHVVNHIMIHIGYSITTDFSYSAANFVADHYHNICRHPC